MLDMGIQGTYTIGPIFLIQILMCREHLKLLQNHIPDLLDRVPFTILQGYVVPQKRTTLPKFFERDLSKQMN